MGLIHFFILRNLMTPNGLLWLHSSCEVQPLKSIKNHLFWHRFLNNNHALFIVLHGDTTCTTTLQHTYICPYTYRGVYNYNLMAWKPAAQPFPMSYPVLEQAIQPYSYKLA